MVLTNSVLRRRYTPPTCTLQIVARSSPLPRLTGQAGNRLLQFDLRFDDPRLPEEKQIHIQGDRDQLEALYEAVTVYTQNLLNQSPERFNTILSVLAPPDKSDGGESFTALNTKTYDAPDVSQEPKPLEFADTSADLNPIIASRNPTTGLFGKIFLQPGRGLSHKLFLGSLATEETGAMVQLSVLQLFDLVTALDEYAADTLLPVLKRPRSAAASPVWASIAAILLVAVGLTTVVLLLNRSNQQQLANRSNSQGSSSNPQQPIALQPTPLAPLPVPTTSLPSPGTLPTLPPVGSVPPPIPTPLGTVPGTLPPNSSPRANTRQIRPTPPTFNTIPKQNSIESLLREASGSRKSGPTTLNIPVPPPAATIPSPNQGTSPNPNSDAASSRINRGAAPETQTSGTPTAQQSPNSANIPNPLGIPTPLIAAGNGNAPSVNGQGLTQTQPPSSSTTPNEPKSGLFDITPQVAEVRNYFKQRWNPPSGLSEALQYTIVLDVDGTIQRIIPLGQASIKYVDRSSMPQVGKRFVSPTRSGQTSRIRVVLFPNGKVQAFPELSNQ